MLRGSHVTVPPLRRSIRCCEVVSRRARGRGWAGRLLARVLGRKHRQLNFRCISSGCRRGMSGASLPDARRCLENVTIEIMILVTAFPTETNIRISCEMHRHVEQVLGKPSRPPRPRPPPRETLRERPRTLGPRAAPSLASGQRFAACAPPRTSQPHTPREAMNPRAPCTPSTGRPRPAWCQVKPCPVQEADDQSFREKWAAALAEIAEAVHRLRVLTGDEGDMLRDAAPPAPLAPPPPPLPLTKPEPHPVPPPLPRSWSHHVPHPPERPVCTAWEAGSCTQRTWEAAEDIPRATAKAQAVHKFTTAAQPQPLGASLYDSSPVTYAELQAAERWMPRSPAAAVPRWHLDGIQEATARAASSSRWRRTQATRGLRTEELLQSSQVSQREMREDPQHCLADLRLRLLSECDKKRLRLVIQSEKSSPTLAGRGQEGLTAKSCTVPWGDDVANSGHFRGKSAPSTESMFEPHQALDAMQAGCTEHDWQALDMKISMLPNLNVPTLGQDGATGGISTSAEDMLAADSHNPCKLSAKKEGMVGVTCPDGVWLTPSFQPFPSAISLGDAAECEVQRAAHDGPAMGNSSWHCPAQSQEVAVHREVEGHDLEEIISEVLDLFDVASEE
ncbi:unnamed protein product [Durusdinium trenchii]|uniref:Uncharacterized protein n=1 Tax=Durusdinium trenchii TaxID=1381693 RepID=A0ABP0RBE7_9DINO